MRYEMRLLESGWAVWDTEANAPAIAEGRWQTDMIMDDADDLTDLLNQLDRQGKMPAAFPPPEEDLGGGDICSPEAEPSTDDDKPLD